MGSIAKLSIPVIGLSTENLKAGTSSRASTCLQVRRALEEYGCFQVNYDKVSLELHNNIFAAAKELFALPMEVKSQKTSDKIYSSYLGKFSFLPLYESVAIDEPENLEATQNFTNLMWPAGNDRFCKSVHSYSKLVAELDQMMMEMLFESYGIHDKFYDAYIGRTNYLLRCFGYKVPQKNETSLGLSPHTDKSVLTILHQDRISGLQIKTKDGDWIDIEPEPSAFVVMAGEALTAWSNDRIKCCFHQVIMAEKEPRYSLGIFGFIKGVVKIPKEMEDEAHPLQYKSFDHFEFLRFSLSEQGKYSNNSIKAFCGVSSNT